MSVCRESHLQHTHSESGGEQQRESWKLLVQQYFFKNPAACTWQLWQSFVPRSFVQKWPIDLTLAVFLFRGVKAVDAGKPV